MGDNVNKEVSAAAKAFNLYPVYTVTNIQHMVRVLDGTKVSYSQWVKLFQLHARGYEVLCHIDGTGAPDKADPEYTTWLKIDSIVLQWIYGTLSDDLLVRVLETESTAQEAWDRIKKIFLNNKGSRAAALEQEFTNLHLRSMPSLEAYCQRLKELSDQLANVDSPINEQRLVLQLVRGLPAEYDTVASYINQSLPSWDTACSMLQLEHHRQSARENISAPTPPPIAAAVDTPLPNRGGGRGNRGGGHGNRRAGSDTRSRAPQQ
ncbi:putative RNA-directed DNA polymerase [Helianthus annuus]|nr:putative RNA-directed DNA polymerase [Helianthus annuus]